MSETLKYGRINAIAKKIKNEIIAPASNKAEIIIQNAKEEAEKILIAAREERNTIVEQGRLEKERSIGSAREAINNYIKSLLSMVHEGVIDNYINNKLLIDVEEKIVEDSEIANTVIDVFCKAVEQNISKNSQAYVQCKNNDIAKSISLKISQSIKDASVEIKNDDKFFIKIEDGKIATHVDSKSIVRSVMASIKDDVRKRVFSTYSIEEIVKDMQSS